jgi:hypothetical protein
LTGCLVRRLRVRLWIVSAYVISVVIGLLVPFTAPVSREVFNRVIADVRAGRGVKSRLILRLSARQRAVLQMELESKYHELRRDAHAAEHTTALMGSHS